MLRSTLLVTVSLFSTSELHQPRKLGTFRTLLLNNWAFCYGSEVVSHLKRFPIRSIWRCNSLTCIFPKKRSSEAQIMYGHWVATRSYIQVIYVRYGNISFSILCTGELRKQFGMRIATFISLHRMILCTYEFSLGQGMRCVSYLHIMSYTS